MTERNAAKFDAYAEEYERLHAESIAVTGEDTDYFAGYKVDCLRRIGVPQHAKVLDFGCGIGNVTCKLVEHYTDVHGYEPSKASAEKARQRAKSAHVHDDVQALPDGVFDVAVLSCVLHHVPPAERLGVLGEITKKLRPGGKLVVFEHNPLNPLTQRAVKSCPFDDDAILLWPWEQRSLLKRAGFADVDLDYIVFFPKALSFMRPLEPKLSWLALGAQTMTIGVKPA